MDPMEVEQLNNGNNIAGVPKDEVDKVVNTWVDVVKIPSIAGGHFTENENFIEISTRWSVMDITKKERVSFHRSFSVLKNSLSWSEGESVIDDKKVIISASGSIPFDGKKICTSDDGSTKAILVEKKPQNGNGESKAELLQIWNQETLLKTYDLNELDKHKSVYCTGGFGATMCWSQDKKKLAYLAEKKVPKTKPFFTSYVKKDEQSNDNDKKDEGPIRGGEYEFKQTWGEQLKDMYFSVIVILDIETDNFQIIELPKDEFPTDIQWVNSSSIVGCSYKIPVWRLGLIFCSNRESRIFQVDMDGNNLKFLSESGRGAVSPRVKPDGKYIIWQERAVDGPHQRSVAVMGSALGTGDNVAAPVCIYAASPDNEIPMYYEFPQNCWSLDGSELYVLTASDGISKLLCLSVESDGSAALINWAINDRGVDSILWVGSKFMLVVRSSSLETPSLELLDISSKNSVRRAIVIKGESPVPGQKIMQEFLLYGESTSPSIFLGPEISSVQPNSVPFIVLPHGGPHSGYLDNYIHTVTYFLRLGFALLKVNYIGSLGSKRDETDKLIGKIGTLDVKDCQNITEKVINSNPSIDRKNVFLFGGSHGGFLGAHLTSSFPEFYNAASILNPVCDLNTMLGTSDIADWVVAESGVELPTKDIASVIPAAKTIEEAQKYLKCSPIANASKVQAATLLCLGTEDLRVPISQGFGYYRALKAFNKIAELRVYPDNHSLSTPSVLNDAVIHSALWFKRFLKK